MNRIALAAGLAISLGIVSSASAQSRSAPPGSRDNEVQRIRAEIEKIRAEIQVLEVRLRSIERGRDSRTNSPVAFGGMMQSFGGAGGSGFGGVMRGGPGGFGSTTAFGGGSMGGGGARTSAARPGERQPPPRGSRGPEARSPDFERRLDRIIRELEQLKREVHDR